MGNSLEISKDVQEISKDINSVQDVADIGNSINVVVGGRQNPTRSFPPKWGPVVNSYTAIEQQIYDRENLGLSFEEFQVHLREVWMIIKLSRPNLTYENYLDERVK